MASSTVQTPLCDSVLRTYLSQRSDLVTDSLDDSLSDSELWRQLQHHRNFSLPSFSSFFTEYFPELMISSLCHLWIDREHYYSFDEDYLYDRMAIPLYEDDQSMAWAISNPFNTAIIQHAYTKPCVFFLVLERELLTFFREIIVDQQTPVSILKQLMCKAKRYAASDLHICRQPQGSDIKLRCEGVLNTLGHIPNPLDEQLLKLIKLRSNMDISITQYAQDGQLTALYGHRDIRVATLPSQHGEDIAFRFFESESRLSSLKDLGLASTALTWVKRSLQRQHGLILVTGPTGSGKSSTLYACLRHLQSERRCFISTLEDPIEQTLVGVRQSQVNVNAQHSFVKGLKALLRQDPDVMMIGEMRDQESAAIALEAAHTGHLVLSSLHTHDTYSALLRLKSFDLDSFMIGQVLTLIVAQRLVPARCLHCTTSLCQDSSESTHCVHCDGKGVSGRALLTECRYFDAPFSFDLETLPSKQSLGQLYSFSDDLSYKISTGCIPADTNDAF
ncbi:MAG: ATPase, T2SS/T4P/T4SS family [bacterium]